MLHLSDMAIQLIVTQMGAVASYGAMQQILQHFEIRALNL